TSLYEADDRIHWIIYILHPLFNPVGCSADHCHGVDEAKFNSIYYPIIQSSGKAIIIQAHTHLTSMGTFNGIPTLVCGGGGEDGTTLGKSNGYNFGTSQPGYCRMHTELGKASASLIGINGQIVHTETWSK